MGPATFSWKYCSVPSSLASGQAFFFLSFFFFHSSEEDLVSNYVKRLRVSFFSLLDTAPNKYFPLAKTHLIFFVTIEVVFIPPSPPFLIWQNLQSRK